MGSLDRNATANSQQYTFLIEELDLMIRARYPLLYVVSVEEEPIFEVLLQVSMRDSPGVATRCPGQPSSMVSQPQRHLLFWDIVRGWSDNGTDKGSVMAALQRIGKADSQTAAMFVLQDLHPFIKNPTTEKNAPIVRELRNLARELKRSRKTIVITSPKLEIPDELLQEVTVVDFPLPNTEEIDYLIQQLVVPDKLNVTGLAREQLVKACQGLSRTRISKVLAKALAAKQQVNESDIDRVLEEKKQAVRQTGILEFFTPQESLKRVGGLDALKQWVLTRQDAFTEEARRYGIPNPKGMLLVGIQGTGKSLSAKTGSCVLSVLKY